MTAVAGQAGGRGRGFGGGGGGFGGGAPAAPSFARLITSGNSMMSSLDSGDMAPNEPTKKAALAIVSQLPTVQAAWKKLIEKDLPEFNKMLEKNKLKPIVVRKG